MSYDYLHSLWMLSVIQRNNTLYSKSFDELTVRKIFSKHTYCFYRWGYYHMPLRLRIYKNCVLNPCRGVQILFYHFECCEVSIYPFFLKKMNPSFGVPPFSRWKYLFFDFGKRQSLCHTVLLLHMKFLNLYNLTLFLYIINRQKNRSIIWNGWYYKNSSLRTKHKRCIWFDWHPSINRYDLQCINTSSLGDIEDRQSHPICRYKDCSKQSMVT